MGDMANIASRLQGLAKPGEILISDGVYESVRADYPGAEERIINLKGIGEPARVYLLISPGD